MEKLAIYGGQPVINHRILINRNKFTKSDKLAIQNYLDSDGTNSYYGDEGLQQTYEKALQQYFSRKYCILVNSGTNAILSAIFSLGLFPGDEVIVPAFSFFAVVSPLLMFHITPVIADCLKDTGLINPDDVMNKISENTKAVIINYVCGDSIDIQNFVNTLHKKNIALIEDISLAFGAKNNGKKLGCFGDITCCSLGSTKLLSGGQGGFIVTDNREYFERIILLGCFGKRAHQNVFNPFYRQFSNVSYGMNNRMHPLAIAVSYSRFLNADKLIKQRHKRYHMLTNCIQNFDFISPPIETDEKDRGSWHGYYAVLNDEIPLNVGKRLVNALIAEGLDVHHGAHYPLINREKIYTTKKDGFFRTRENPFKLGKESTTCVGAEHYNNHIISFPLFLDEEKEIVEAYCYAIDKVFSQIEKM